MAAIGRASLTATRPETRLQPAGQVPVSLIADLRACLGRWAGGAGALDELRTALGPALDAPAAERLLGAWAAGLVELPAIRLVADAVLGGAAGAYAGAVDTIFLAERFVAAAPGADVVRVLVEEVGHALDARLNAHEAPGDEGAIFAALVLGDRLDAEALAALRAENDWAFILVDGAVLQVECAQFNQARIDALREGFASSVDAVANAAAQKTLGQSMPLFGNGLLAGYQNNVVSPFRGFQQFKGIVYNALGRGGLLGAPDANGNWTEVQVAAAINTALNNSGIFTAGNPTSNNTQVTYDTTANEFVFSSTATYVPFTQALDSSANLGLNGLLSMSTAGTAQLGLDYTINLAMGFDTEFYLRTDRTGTAPELQFGMDVKAVPTTNGTNPNLSVGADLTLAGGQIFAVSVLPTTQVEADFALDLTDNIPTGNNDGRLRLGELDGANRYLGAKASGALALDLALDTPDSLSGVLDLHTELSVDWDFTRDSSGFFGSAPTVTLKNTQLDFLSFLNDVLKPFLDSVRGVMEPVGKILDVLKADITPLSNMPGGGAAILDVVDENDGFKAGHDGKISLLDLAKVFKPVEFESARRLLATIDDISSWYRFLDTPLSFSDRLKLGDFRITSDIRDGTFSFDAATKVVDAAAQDLEQFIGSQIGGLNAGASARTLTNILAATRAGTAPVTGAAANTIAAPFLAGGQSALSYLFGQKMDLIKFDLPRLDFSFGGEVDAEGRLTGPLTTLVPIPIFGLPLVIEGGLRASIDLDFGYDTRGLQHYLQSATRDQSKLLDGIFVTDWGANGQERPEILLGGQLNFGLKVDSPIAGAFAGGALEGVITLDLIDAGTGPDAADDGKVHYDELASTFSDPLKFFEGRGEITAGLIAYAHFLGFVKEYRSPTITLGEFEFGGEDAPTLDPRLFSRTDDGDYILHVGDNAGFRAIANQLDEADTFTIKPSKDGKTFTVAAYGYRQRAAAGGTIQAGMGLLDDRLDVGSTLMASIDADGGQGNDLLSGGALADTLLGGADNDVLIGEGGADSLDGGAGEDVLDGGAGADTIRGGAGTDILTYARSTGAVTIQVDTSFTMFGLGGDAAGDMIVGVENIIGSNQADLIASNDFVADVNVFAGLRGDDSLFGGGGNDVLVGGEGKDILNGGGGDDTLGGGLGDDLYRIDSLGDVVDEDFGGEPSDGNDTIEAAIDYSLNTPALSDIENLILVEAGRRGTGNAGANRIVGSGGADSTGDDWNDLLSGLAGNDTIRGLKGNDTLEGGDGGDSLDGGAGDDRLDGGSDADTLLGGDGFDVLEGGDGSDSLVGGTGSDSYLVDDAGDVVVELAGEGDDVVSASVDYVLAAGAAVEVLQTSNGTAVTTRELRGNAFSQVLVGDAGDNVLEGMGGADILSGGDGYDTASYEHASAAVTLAFGRTGVVGTGDAEGDTYASIEAFRGSDLLVAGDSLVGNDDANTFHGLGGDDVLAGLGGGDSLFGGAGDDTLDGGTGDDTMSGGAGNDVYMVDSLGDVVDDDRTAYRNGGGGRDRIVASLDYSLGASTDRADIEELELAGNARIGTGNALDNLVIGTEGADTLDGAMGADTLVGGAGDDIYDVDRPEDRVVELAGEGTDEIRVAGANWTIRGIWYDPYPLATIDMRVDWLAHVENMILDGGYRIALIGNDLDNRLVGNGWDGTDLTGGAGNDTLVVSSARHVASGGDGFDTLVVDWSNSTAFYEGGAGAGVLEGSLAAGYSGNFNTFYSDASRVTFSGIERFDLTLRDDRDDDVTTGDGDDTVRAGGGNDVLRTGRGNDKVHGGAGSDHWVADRSTMSAAQSLTLDLGRSDIQSTYYRDGAVDTTAGEVSGIESVALETGAGDDVILTINGFRNDTITTGAGNDTVKVAGGQDVVAMGEGTDTLILDWSDYTAFYASGVLAGVTGGSLATGYSGNFNSFYADAYRATFTGVERFDLTLRDDRDDDVTTGDGDDVLRGNGGNDVLRSAGGNDTVLGGAGDDRLETGTGLDVVDGGAGNDRWEADQSGLAGPQAVILDLNLAGVQGSFGAAGSISGIEMVSLTTGAGADHVRTLGTVVADAGLFGFNDVVTTGDGADTVEVFGGRDIVAMGANAGGQDTLVVDWSRTDYGMYFTHPWIAEFSGSLAEGYSGTFATGDPRDHLRVDFSGVERFLVKGGSANDAIRTGDGDDLLSGGAGNDLLYAIGGDDLIFGGAGDDVLDGGSGSNILFGEEGNDTLFGGAGLDNLFGGADNDILIGGAGDDGLSGEDGDDRINAGDGNDLILGGAGADELGGGTGNDTLLGQDGSDTLFGEAGDDRMNGGADNDILVGGAGNDELGGGSGDDVLVGNEDDDTLFGEDGNDRLSGGSGADTLVGGLGSDELGGDDGDDVLVGNEGTDMLFGGIGNDRLNGGSDADILLGNEGSDELGGGSGDDVLAGGADADVLFGEEGNDTLDGGTGDDILIGGANADQYNFGANSGADIIVGFNAAEGDRLALYGQSYVLGQDQYGNALLSLSGGGSVALSTIAAGQVNAGYFA